MTEADWLTCANTWLMVSESGAAVSDRKVRLFVCACCRRLWPRLTDARLRTAVERAEEHAEGLLTPEAVARAADLAEEVARANFRLRHIARLVSRATSGSHNDLANLPHKFADLVACDDSDEVSSAAHQRAYLAEQERQLELLRDIFGNPFRPVAFAPAWRTDTAVTLARTMYESREFGAMPILADAIQDAGCDSDDILNHCRDAKQPHVRGCWVVDLVLGKS